MEENKQIEKFDPSKLMDGVKDRIKATFVSLIPDDQWENMVKLESEKFFEKRVTEKDYYGKATKWKESEFEELVINIMKEKCKEVIKSFFDDPKYQITHNHKFNNNTMSGYQEIIMSDYLENIIKEKMPDMMQQMFVNTLSGAFYQLFNQLKNNNQLH